MKILQLVTLSAILLLTACASQYSITEGELEDYLSDSLHFEVKQGNQLFGIEMNINDIEVSLGSKPNIMSVTTTAFVQVTNPILPLKAKLHTQFEAKPWYDAQTHSVYLKDLKLVEVRSSPKEIQKTLNQVTPQLMQFVSQFLETQPVYVLDTQKSSQALIAKMTKSIQVKPGKLLLIFDE